MLIQQKKKTGAQKDARSRSAKARHSVLFNKQALKGHDHWNYDYNFLVTNFEPFQVAMYLKKAQEQKSTFRNIQKIEGMQSDEKSVRQILKIKDLQAFGNSIVEIMVGRYEEMEKQEAFAENKDKRTTMATRDAIQIMQGDTAKK